MYVPKISVMIPTYDRKEMLQQALDSVLKQNYPSLEIVVSDNASSDGTHLMMEQYCEKYPFIKYIRRSQNIGAVKNGELAYQEVTGEYFMILCDDDLMKGTDFFSKAVKAMEENEKIAFTRGLAVMFYEDEEIHYTLGGYDTRSLISGLEFYLNYERPGYEHVVSFFGLCRKEYIDQSGIMNIHAPGLDRWLWSVLPLYGDVYFIPEVMGYYRQHFAQDSVGEGFSKEILSAYAVIKFISDKAVQLYPQYKQRILSMRPPEIEAAWVILFGVDILKKHKTDKEILILLKAANLQQHPVLYRELLKIARLRPRDKVVHKISYFINSLLRFIKVKIVRI